MPRKGYKQTEEHKRIIKRFGFKKRNQSGNRKGKISPQQGYQKNNTLRKSLPPTSGCFKKGQIPYNKKGSPEQKYERRILKTLKERENIAGSAKPEQCEICGAFGKDFKKGLCFDHDHTTGKFRGWICMRCNFALGLVKDNSELLIKLSKYLKQ